MPKDELKTVETNPSDDFAAKQIERDNPEQSLLNMKNNIIKSIIESEAVYLDCLNTLIQVSLCSTLSSLTNNCMFISTRKLSARQHLRAIMLCFRRKTWTQSSIEYQSFFICTRHCWMGWSRWNITTRRSCIHMAPMGPSRATTNFVLANFSTLSSLTFPSIQISCETIPILWLRPTDAVQTIQSFPTWSNRSRWPRWMDSLPI